MTFDDVLVILRRYLTPLVKAIAEDVKQLNRKVADLESKVDRLEKLLGVHNGHIV